jgi:hypothetical protein
MISPIVGPLRRLRDIVDMSLDVQFTVVTEIGRVILKDI